MRRPRIRRSAVLIAAAVVTGSVAVVAGPAAPAAAVGPSPQFSAPFRCGVDFRSDSYDAEHAPALDMVLDPQSVTEGAPVVAAAAGRVNQSYFKQSSAGNIIQVDHGNGWFTTYIHLQSRSVAVGDTVAKGARIGAVGKTGDTSNGNVHLHFEVGQDLDGSGDAEWGNPTRERVPPVLNGQTFGAVAGETKYATSGNCGSTGASTVSVGGRSYEFQNQQHVVGRSTTDTVMSYWYLPGSGWQAPAALDQKTIAGQPVGISAFGQQHVFAQSSEGKLSHRWYDPGDPWVDKDMALGTLRGTPATCTYRTGGGEQLHVFGSTAEGKLGHWWYQPDGLSWRYAELPDGTAAGGPTCVAWRNQLQVFARSASGEVDHWWYLPDGAGWRHGPLRSDTEDTTITGDPAATTYAPPGTDQVNVFARSTGGHLVQWWYEEGAGWRYGDIKPGSPFVGTPTAGTLRDTSPPQLQVFGRTAGGGLRHFWYAPGAGWKVKDEATSGVGGDPTLLVYTSPGPDQTNVFAKAAATPTLTQFSNTNGWAPGSRGGSVAY